MSIYGTSINESPVVELITSSAIEGAPYLAVTMQTDGGVAVSKAGDTPIGLLCATDKDGTIHTNERVTVQVKDMGLWTTGEAVAAGTELTSGADGKAVAANAGNYILAVALEASTAAGQIIQVQIVKSGYKPAASGS